MNKHLDDGMRAALDHDAIINIGKLSHPTSMNEAPAYGKTMPSGGRAMGSFDAAYDGRTPIAQDLSLLRDFRPLKAGQKYGQRGSTVFNPKPEDPEQEAIYGKREYKEKISQEDPRAVIDKMNVQNKEIADLKSQLAMLVKIVTSQNELINQVDIAKDEVRDYEDMKYPELIKLAKTKGLGGLSGISKADVITKLKELDA